MFACVGSTHTRPSLWLVLLCITLFSAVVILPHSSQMAFERLLRSLCKGKLLVLFIRLSTLWAARADFLLPPLPFPPFETEPVIDTKTNLIHHNDFHALHVNRLNAALKQAPQFSSLSLSALLPKIGTGTIPANIEPEIRNQGGGTWNHDMYWLILTQPGSLNADTTKSISPSLKSAIDSSFGSVDNMLAKFNGQSKALFGSGWTWLIVKPDGGLAVVGTPNQDNTLMNLPGAPRGIPILGNDLWEHNYVLKYIADKDKFVDEFPKVINWVKVSENYDLAKNGSLAGIIGSA